MPLARWLFCLLGTPPSSYQCIACQQLAPILCNVACLRHNHSASFGYITKCTICVGVAKVSTETLRASCVSHSVHSCFRMVRICWKPNCVSESGLLNLAQKRLALVCLLHSSTMNWEPGSKWSHQKWVIRVLIPSNYPTQLWWPSMPQIWYLFCLMKLWPIFDWNAVAIHNQQTWVVPLPK